MAEARPFTPDPALTAVVVGKKNPMAIADQVLPRRPVGNQLFEYWDFSQVFQDALTLPNAYVGRASRPQSTETGWTKTQAATRDYALDDPVPLTDKMAAAASPGAPDPELVAAEYVAGLLELAREKRVADLVFAAGTYPTANKTTLTATARWSDASSDPIKAMLQAMDGMIMRPNTLVLGRKTATYLALHPKVNKAVNKTSGDAGVVSMDFLRQILELDRILIGDAWINTARKGKTASYAKLWGPHAALLALDVNAMPQNKVTTFGWTAQWGEKVGGRIADPHLGMRGGNWIRAGESVLEHILDASMGYLFTNAGDDS